MEKESWITVEHSESHYDDFVNFMNATTDALKEDGRNRKEYYVRQNGEKLENDVIRCMRAKANDFRLNPELIKLTLPQHFPDIVSNRYYGVEVKSTKKNSWKSVGSSIVESLREADVKKIFMMFGILSKENVDFRCKPYEQCLCDINVTHSPRYAIDMDLKSEKGTIFSKMRIGYDEFRNMGPNQIEKVRSYYREKYRDSKAKTMPWWIGDSLESEAQDFQLFADLDNEAVSAYIGRIYALFPEVLGTSQDKFRRSVLWLCARHSIICSNVRDYFTAGGRGDIYIQDKLKWKDVPKVICNLLPHVRRIQTLYTRKTELAEEFKDFATFSMADEMVDFNVWKECANRNIRQTLKGNNSTLTVDALLKYDTVFKKQIGNKDCFCLS
jgi:hypothetical protein